MDEWYQFCKSKASYGFHPEWAGIKSEFKEVCIKNPKAIFIK